MAGNRPYALLVKGMQDANVVGIAQVVLSGREQLVCLRPVDDMLTMSGLPARLGRRKVRGVEVHAERRRVHDGEKPNGWVEFLRDGKLATKWGSGDWRLHEQDNRKLDITFNTARHVCVMGEDEKTFAVVEKFLAMDCAMSAHAVAMPSAGFAPRVEK